MKCSFALPLVLIATAVTGASALSLTQSPASFAVSMISTLFLLQSSTTSAYALPQDPQVVRRHDRNPTDDQGVDVTTGNGDRQRNRGNRGGGNGDRDGPGRGDGNSQAANATNSNQNSVDDEAKGRDTKPVGSSADSNGTNVGTDSPNGSQLTQNATSTVGEKAALSTGSGNAAIVNGTLPGAENGGGGSASTGTLPAGYPPAPPEPGFVAGGNKRSLAYDVSSSVQARRNSLSGKRQAQIKGRVPVAPVRDVYRKMYDI